MRNDPYRHSVWIDVFGVLLAGAVLLGGAGYLLYHAGEAGASFAPAASWQGRAALASRGARRPPARRAPARGGGLSLPGSSPLSGGRPAPGGDVAVPFSDGWQKEAAPELTGPSGSSGGPPQGGSPGNGGRAPGPSGPAIASSSSYGGVEGGGRQAGGGGSPPSSWRAKARRFSGRARALSNQLGQMAHSSSGQEKEKKAAPKEASGQGSAAGASTSDRTVGEPPSVPIDDHVHWLLVAGVLWGVWRIWRGG